MHCRFHDSSNNRLLQDTIAALPGNIGCGTMLVPVICGSDKTTVSVVTGHQEYHPVYASPANLSNTVQRARGNGVLPFVFLPIPKGTLSIGFQVLLLPSCHSLINHSFLVSKAQRNNPNFQRFQRQLYHACLEFILSPLKDYMEKAKVIHCPDGLF